MNQKTDQTDQNNILRLAAIPVFDYEQTYEAGAVVRLENYLSQLTGVRAEVVLPRSYDEVLSGMEQGTIDAARLGPYAFALAQTRFGARALVNAVDLAASADANPVPYRSVIFTRSDSNITGLAQLKGHKFGFVDRNSTTGYLVATFLLQQAGLDATRDLEPLFLLTHNAVVEAVAKGEVLAGAVREEELISYTEKNNQPILRVLATSALIPKGPVAVRPDLPRNLERKLQTALVQLHRQLDNEAAGLISSNTQRFTPAAPREITLKTIAELTGVSYATVSRAISGRDRIAPETTARIRKLVDELGYRPNANARSLQKSTGDLVGLFLPSLAYPDLDAIVEGAQTVLSPAGLQLVICPGGKPTGSTGVALEKAYFELLYASRLEGVLLTQWSLVGAEAGELARTGRPAALLEQELLEESLKTGWDWLRQQGHNRIGLVASPHGLLEPNIARQTLLRQTGADFEFIMLENPPSEWLKQLLQKSSPPTALLCTDDQLGVQVQQTARRLNLSLTVLGIGNSPLLRLAELSSVTFDGYAVGQNAARRLLKLLGRAVTAPPAALNCRVQ